jgi:hypothetical protein
MIAHGAITNLDAKPKTGKTTFALMLVSASLHPDRRFLDRPVEFDRVIYLTEQGVETFKEQMAAAGIGRDVVDRVDVVPWSRMHARPWDDVLAVVRRRIERWQADMRVLLVVDTLSKWSRIPDENDATAAMAAYRPLVLLTQELHLATLVLRHARKGDHEDATDTARGSNAASGEADIILTLGRLAGRPGEGRHIRRLRGVGRYGGIPEDLSIELRDGEYVVLPDGSEVQAIEHRARIERFLSESAGATYESITAGNGITRSSVETVLGSMRRPPGVVVVRTNSGRKGDPYRFWLTAHSPGNPVSEEPRSSPSPTHGSVPFPAAHGPFSGESHAHDPGEHGWFPGPSPFPPETLSVQPGDDDDDLWDSMPDLPPSMVAIARVTFAGLIADERTTTVPEAA